LVLTPSIATLSSTSAAVGAWVTVTGANFGANQGASLLKFNGVSATPWSWNDTSIVASVPTGATSGNVTVTVNGATSNGIAFTVLPTPTITGLNPTSATPSIPYQPLITINGTGFGASQGSSTVAFNGLLAAPTSQSASTSWSNTQIVVYLPSGATTGNV